MTRETLIIRLLDAAARGQVNVMRRIIDSDVTLAESSSSGAEDAIFYAVGNNHIRAVQFLINCGVNLFKTYTFGENLLRISESNAMKRLISSAMLQNSIENEMNHVTESLLTGNSFLDVDYQDKNGETALMKMLRQENCSPQQIRQILIRGADVNLSNNSGETALDLATNPEIRNILLENARETATLSLGDSVEMSVESENSDFNRTR